MLLSSSPQPSAFMPMSSPDTAMLYHHHNFSDDDGCPSVVNALNGVYAAGGSRMLNAYSTFPPMSVKPKVVRPSKHVAANAGNATVSILHRRTTTYNLSLQDFQQLTNKILDNGKNTANGTGVANGGRPSKSACRAIGASATFAGGELSMLADKCGKKRVVFADDRGFKLTEIRVMTEPSDVPPKIRSSVFRALLGDAYGEYDFVAHSSSDCSAEKSSCWTLTFKQPASDYITFRKRLDEINVCLENVLLKNGAKPKLVGTVKVKNLSFEKHVLVRFTDDKWLTYTDHPCVFTPHIGNVQDGSAYDTFQFEFEVPKDAENRRTLEMCVCYRDGNGREYWDNNSGLNFKISSSNYAEDKNSNNNTNNDNNNNKSDQKPDNDKHFSPFSTTSPCSDAFAMDLTNWAQFASWNHLTTEGPYW